MNTKSTLAMVFSAVALGGISPALASDIHDDDRADNSSKLDFYLRAVLIDTRLENEIIEQNFGGFSFGNELGGTALGLVADYNSGYWNNIGFDASLYGVAKIDSRTESRDLFDDTSGENRGFAKLGQAFLKFRHDGENWATGLQVGRGRFDAGTVVTLDTRAVPGSLQGARGQVRIEELGIGPLPGVLYLDGAYINGVSPRDRDGFEEIVSNSGVAPSVRMSVVPSDTLFL